MKTLPNAVVWAVLYRRRDGRRKVAGVIATDADGAIAQRAGGGRVIEAVIRVGEIEFETHVTGP